MCQEKKHNVKNINMQISLQVCVGGAKRITWGMNFMSCSCLYTPHTAKCWQGTRWKIWLSLAKVFSPKVPNTVNTFKCNRTLPQFNSFPIVK